MYNISFVYNFKLVYGKNAKNRRQNRLSAVGPAFAIAFLVFAYKRRMVGQHTTPIFVIFFL